MMLFLWQYFEATLSIHYKMLQGPCWWNLQRVVCSGSILQNQASFTFSSQNGREGKKLQPIFIEWEQWLLMDNVMQQQKPYHSITYCLLIAMSAMQLKCSRWQCCITANLNAVRRKEKAVAAKITSVSVSPLIPFNPSKLMSSITAHQHPHPTLHHRHKAMKTGAMASASPIDIMTQIG